MEEDDLLGDVKDIRLDKEKGKLTKLRVWYLIIIIVFASLVATGLWIYISGQDLSWLAQKIPGIATSRNQEDSSEATPSWKTYTDTDMGYAFKYPAVWDNDVLVTSAIGSYDRVSFVRVDPDVVYDKEGGTVLEVEFWVTVYNKKYPTYVIQRDKDTSFTSQKSENATFASKNGKKYTFTSSEFRKQLQSDIVITLGDDKTIVLSYLTDSEESENIVNILKSFRFN